MLSYFHFAPKSSVIDSRVVDPNEIQRSFICLLTYNLLNINSNEQLTATNDKNTFIEWKTLTTTMHFNLTIINNTYISFMVKPFTVFLSAL
jgi:hypothetical protein